MRYATSMSNKEDRGEALYVKELFPTIQGEGPLAGEPCVFVRLQGCNLKCWFCDTDFENGDAWMVPKLFKKLMEIYPAQRNVVSSKQRLCVITGGEPMMQRIGLLVTTLLGNKWRVQIETAGTLWEELPESPDLEVVCSPKTAKVHPEMRKRVTAWKYLIRADDSYDPADGLPISNTQDVLKAGGLNPSRAPLRPMAKPTKHAPVFLQPVEESTPEETGRNITEAVDRALRYGYRLSLQQHKILGVR